MPYILNSENEDCKGKANIIFENENYEHQNTYFMFTENI
jgi:hypothetical protein